MKLSQALAAGKNISREELENLALPRYGFQGDLENRRDLLRWLRANPHCDVNVRETEPPPVGQKTLRPEQNKFRAAVFRAYAGKCAVTGEAAKPALEAAHLPGRRHQSGSNSARDGILLRSDLHKLMDAKPPLLTLVRENGDIIVRIRKGAGPNYQKLNGKKIRLPKRILDRPAL